MIDHIDQKTEHDQPLSDEDFNSELESKDEVDSESEEATQKIASDFRLGWLVEDFNGIASSVYEAVMVVANRSRQIGARQKEEIDLWNAEHDPTLGGVAIEDEETVVGVDHFHHLKPTVQALYELKEGELKFNYPKDKESD